MLYGRDSERATIIALLTAARQSRSGVLILRGDAGVGKTALLEEARASAVDMHVLSAHGVESEADLPFAALHQLVRPALGRLDRLPGPQATALAGALGLTERGRDDRFLVSVACLTLLSELAERRPVLCLVDDAQWLDAASADTLLFVARRLGAEAVVLLVAARADDASTFYAPDVPSLDIPGLAAHDAATLLASAGDVRVAADVRDYLIEQTRGNPLALLELTSALSADQLHGREPIEHLPVTGGIERVFLRRIRDLPRASRQLLLVAAADDTGELTTVLQASEPAGNSRDALSAAEQAGLVSVSGARLEFRHPLVRSAVYGGATSEERRAAHDALAAALPKDEADRRAWHRAAAAVEPDEEIAGELATTATRAARRGGFAAASLALERAAQLTTGETTRASRLVEAAQASMLAGKFDRATTLVGRAEPLLSDPLLNAEVGLMRGSVELWIGSAPRAAEMFTATAEDVAPHNSSKALELLMMAAEAAAMAGTHDQLAHATRIGAGYTADPDNDEQIFSATFLRGLRHFLDGDRASAAPLLRSCLDQASRFDDPRRTLWAAGAAFYLGDRDVRQAFLDRAVELTRGAGAIGLLPYPLAWRAGSEFQLGRIAEAAADADEAVTLARDIGLEGATAYPTAILARVAGLQGRDQDCRALASDALALAAAHGLAVAAAHAELARAELALSRGRWVEALDHLEALADVRPGRGHPVFSLGTTPDLIEAAVRAGRHRRAREALGPYEEWVRLAGVSWESPRLARCQALLSPAGDAAQYFNEALRFDGGLEAIVDRARTQLLYGEHLRVEGQLAEASEQLRIAVETFERLGADGWADRARAELQATGETLQPHDPSAIAQLSPQELQIVRLVAEGHSNREVAARLFLSPRTIDVQLQGAFKKLGISSRVELAGLGLAAEPSFDVLRSRLARAGLAELLRDLRALRGGALQTALARTIGDPDLVVAHRAPGSSAYADADGSPVRLPGDGDGRGYAPVEVDGREVAALVYDASLDDDPELIEAVCAAAAIALENEQLQAESEARLTELRASRQRVIAAGDAERRRLERNLHDGAQQQLLAVALQLRLIQRQIRQDPSAAEALVTNASDQLAESLQELRELARGMHPAVLEFGLASALDSLAARTTVPTAVSCEVAERLPQQVELALYFVACEALANVAKYAAA